MKNKLSKNENKALNYLRNHETLTTYEAVTVLRIMNVQDCIMRLRRYGYNIIGTWKTALSNKRYTEYKLEKPC